MPFESFDPESITLEERPRLRAAVSMEPGTGAASGTAVMIADGGAVRRSTGAAAAPVPVRPS
ncbi:hypothetical protein OG810_02825 [Streptomyces sp. NBC_01693]|uniref:hypothetical protein n=1 Tax=unclassified Streptomyces TaxID=2593676 RepID=UPI0029BE527C|nr:MULTISPECIES: hypothetical protein [unclassified Streptomyces]MDX3432244.1 hypothetical protein [Streptomyces sp. ME01-18a]